MAVGKALTTMLMVLGVLKEALPDINEKRMIAMIIGRKIFYISVGVYNSRGKLIKSQVE